MDSVATTAAPAPSFSPIDHTWSFHLDEVVVVLASECGAECALTISYREDCSHGSCRVVWTRIADVEGDPSGAAWLDSRAEDLLIDWRDAERARREGRCC